MINISTNAMVFRTFEPWVSKTDLCKYLNVHKNYLEKMYPIFSEGIHYRHKNPLNKGSHKVWKISKVEQLLCDSSSGLARRLKRIAWPTQTLKKPKNTTSIYEPETIARLDLNDFSKIYFLETYSYKFYSFSTPRNIETCYSNGSRYLLATS